MNRIPAKTVRRRGWEALLALGLFLSFFAPWLRSLGKPVAGPEIRTLLEAPHRLVSIFHPHSRVSADYRLSAFLWAVPIAAALVLIAIALGRYRGWMGLLAGCVAATAFIYLKRELAGFPFHHLAWGSYVALMAGVGLSLSPLLRFPPR
jgi:asparagine N-glycosylation enzyme membrane subunit Stt3